MANLTTVSVHRPSISILLQKMRRIDPVVSYKSLCAHLFPPIVPWYHTGRMKSARVEIFRTQVSTHIRKQEFFFFSRELTVKHLSEHWWICLKRRNTSSTIMERNKENMYGSAVGNQSDFYFSVRKVARSSMKETERVPGVCGEDSYHLA